MLSDLSDEDKKELEADLTAAISELCDKYNIFPIDLCPICSATKLRKNWGLK